MAEAFGEIRQQQAYHLRPYQVVAVFETDVWGVC